jgi:hypothetical protein
MGLSSGQRQLPVGSSISEHRPQDIDSAACQRYHGLIMHLAFGSFSAVVGSAFLVMTDRAVRRLVEDSFQRPVALFRSSLVREATRCSEHGRELPAAAAKRSGEP